MHNFDESIRTLAADVLALCRSKGLTAVTAESCTGGLVAGALTEIPGSSDVLDRSFVTYSYAAKTAMLGVPEDILLTHGAVSEPVARTMAAGALRASNITPDRGIAVAVTGIAGPGGGTAEKPAGLVHFAAARGDRMIVDHHIFPGDRGEVRYRTVARALAMIRILAEE